MISPWTANTNTQHSSFFETYLFHLQDVCSFNCLDEPHATLVVHFVLPPGERKKTWNKETGEDGRKKWRQRKKILKSPFPCLQIKHALPLPHHLVCLLVGRSLCLKCCNTRMRTDLLRSWRRLKENKTSKTFAFTECSVINSTHVDLN